MNWLLMEIKETRLVSPSQEPIFVVQPPPPTSSSFESSGFNLNDKVSPSILLIIIILAIIVFISGLLHLLVRFLLRPPRRDPDEMDDVTALQGQLQQLFHLHDAGVDQSYIDNLPVFSYKAIIGVKSPFDCAVCLSEFEPEDSLRLLPKCSHAFHMECIDTWLLSHSTCPLCRASLLVDFSSHRNFSPIVLVLESGNESSREIVAENTSNSAVRTESHHVSAHWDSEPRVSLSDLLRKSCEIKVKEEENPKILAGSGEKIVQVKLGKFRNVDGGTGECSSENNVDERRCFSMGSFAYVMDENSSLQVPIRTPVKKPPSNKKTSLPLIPCHRAAMSECGWDSRREFIGFDALKSLENHGDGGITTVTPQISCTTTNIRGDGKSVCHNDADNKACGSGKRESFSISKIWLRGKGEKQHNLALGETSRRAVSLRFPFQGNAVVAGGESKANTGGGSGGGGGGGGSGTRRTVSEVNIDRWQNGGSEFSNDVEMQGCNCVDCQGNHPSFARKTFLWLMGSVKQPKVLHSSFSSNL